MLDSHRHRQGVVFALITAICLGSITTQAKIYYDDGGNALTLMLVRFVVCTLTFAAMVRLGRFGFRVESEHRKNLVLIGCVWSAAMICYLMSVQTVSVSLAVLILYTYPLLVLAHNLATRQLSPSPGLILLFVVAFSGLYLALSGDRSELAPLGLLLAVLASIGSAVTFISGARLAPLLNPLVMTFWISLTGLIIVLPLSIADFSIGASAQAMASLGLATVFYLVAILCQFEALARLPASIAAFILNLEPVVSILLAMAILGEDLLGPQWLGVGLVIAVLIGSIRIGNRPKPDRQPG